MQKQKLPENLRICMLARSFPIGSRSEELGFLWPIARGLTRAGHKIVVLSWAHPQNKFSIVEAGVEVHFLATNREPFSEKEAQARCFYRFRELHSQTPFHLVHSIDSLGLQIGLKKRTFKIPMLYDVQATRMSELFAVMAMAQESVRSYLATGLMVAYLYLKNFLLLDRKVIASADAMFVTSPQQKMALERYYYFPEYRTYSVPYGIELGDLSTRPISTEMRARFGIPAGGKVILTVSDYTEKDALKNTLKAFERLVIKKPHSHLVIAGTGPHFKEIEYEMLTLALVKKVTLLQAYTAEDLQELLSICDIYLSISSKTSGFEPSLLEAMSQKKIVIGSEVTPISSIVTEGIDGFLVRPADVGGLANLLVRICSDQVPQAQIGDLARQKVLEIFDTQKMVRETLNAYYKTLKNTGYYFRTDA